MNRATFLVGMLGLNEMVQYHLGKELHEDQEAFKFGLARGGRDALASASACPRSTGMRFLLEQTPAESTAYRMAKLDLQYYPAGRGRDRQGRIAGRLGLLHQLDLHERRPAD